MFLGPQSKDGLDFHQRQKGQTESRIKSAGIYLSHGKESDTSNGNQTVVFLVHARL